MLALVDMAPNATHLRVTESIDSFFYIGLQDRLFSSHSRLKTLDIQTYEHNRAAYEFLNLLTCLEPFVSSLRTIQFREAMGDGDPNEYSSSDRYRPSYILEAISQASSVSCLRLPIEWRDSY